MFVKDEAGNISSYDGASTGTLVSGMSLWLDAQRTDTLTLDGNSVGRWEDLSGNSNHAVQTVNIDSTSTNGDRRPLFQDSSLRNYDSIKFDGDLLEISSLDLRAEEAPLLSMFAIYQYCNPSSGYSNEAIFVGMQNDYDRRTWQGLVHSDDQATSNILSASYSYCSSSDTTCSSSTQRYWTNGQEESFTAVDYATGSTRSAGVAIGTWLYANAAYYGAYHPCFNLGELIIYQDELTDSERQAIERYLSNKWNISLQSHQ